MRFLRGSGKVGFAPPGRPRGHAYLLLGHSPRKMVDDGVLLAGDAAGLAYAQSGEGICPAIESGLLAAEILQSAQGQYGRDRLGAYPGLLASRLNHGPSFAETVAKHFPAGLRNGLARLLLRTEWFCRSVVLEKWFLHRENQHL